MTDLSVIHKRAIKPAEIVRLPLGSKIIAFNDQYGQFCIWYSRPQFDSGSYDEWQLVIVGTGDPYESNLDYIAGPAFVNSGSFVFHLVGRHLGSG